MIEKVKGNKTSKLRVMQITETHLQSLMREFLRFRIKENYENEKRILKHDYGSRKGYSIELVLLEKRLIFDLVKKAEEVFSYTACDLESCYNIKFPDKGGIVEESMGSNRRSIKLSTKMLPKCKHCIGTTHSANIDYCGGSANDVGVTGQRNVLSSCVCRDTSCFIFKELEKRTRHNDKI